MKILSRVKTHGLICLKQADGKFYKRAILCRTGVWEGMNGPVTVSQQMLQALADNYNAERADAINENDYAPILKDHERKVDNILGRIDISQEKLSVELVPGSKKAYGLFGPLRVDTDDAQEKVNLGTYAQLSLTFDDETNEIFEVSFVAVEAARRSQVLSKGEPSMKNKKKVSKRTNSLALVNASNKKVSLALVTGVTKVTASVSSLQLQINEIGQRLKGAGIKSRLCEFIREGKMSKDEMTKLNIKSLSALDSSAVNMVLDSYKNRKSSGNIGQFGQEGAKSPTESLSSKDFKKLKELQLGKKTRLAEGEAQEETDAEKKAKEELRKLAAEANVDASLEAEDVKDIEAVLAKCLEGLKTIGTELASLQSSATELSVEVKEEEELASGDEDEDSDADEEDDK